MQVGGPPPGSVHRPQHARQAQLAGCVVRCWPAEEHWLHPPPPTPPEYGVDWGSRSGVEAFKTTRQAARRLLQSRKARRIRNIEARPMFVASGRLTPTMLSELVYLSMAYSCTSAGRARAAGAQGRPCRPYDDERQQRMHTTATNR